VNHGEKEIKLQTIEIEPGLADHVSDILDHPDPFDGALGVRHPAVIHLQSV